LAFGSCRGKRALVRGEQATSARQLVQFIEQAQPKFNTLDANSVSINANLGGNNMSITATMQIKTDSIIVLTGNMMRFVPVFRLELHPNHWILFNKVHRAYYTDRYQYFYYAFGVNVNFETFQSLFSAQLFSIGEREVDARRLEFTPLEDNRNKLTFESRNMIQTTTTHGNHTIEQVVLRGRNQPQTLVATYSDYNETRGINYPRNINIELLDGEQTVFGLDMRIQRVSFNSDVQISSPNRQRFTRSTIDQLLRQL
jgi:hypothetical protein